MRAVSVITEYENPSDTITLDETARHRRRIRMVSDGGVAFLLDLPEARLLSHGDGLVLEDGRIIKILAAPEDLYEVRADDSRRMAQLAWQLGNRHLAAQISHDCIFIRKDPVIKEMLVGLGARVEEVSAPFQPETGAYAGAGHSHHREDHDHE